MAKQRYINTIFWKDEFVAELEPLAKLLFIYLFTNPHATIAGAYQITIREIVFDTGLDRKKVVELLELFERADKAIFRDGWLFLPNFIKHQNHASPKIKNGILHALKDCPTWVVDTVSIRYGYGIDTVVIPLARNTNSNFNSNSNKQDVGRASRTHAPEATKKPATISTKAKRISPDFSLTPEMETWAKQMKIPDALDLAEITETFKNHYLGTSGEKSESPDWVSLWKNWVLKDKKKFIEENKPNGQGKKPNSKNKFDAIGERDYSKFDALEFEQ